MKTAGNDRKGIEVTLFDGHEPKSDGVPRAIVTITRPGMSLMAHYAGRNEIMALRTYMAEGIALIDELFPEETE